MYIVYLAVGQYNRRNAAAVAEELASDTQTAGWALQLDARRRLDSLLVGSVDPALRTSLVAANGRDAIPDKSRTDANAALTAINERKDVIKSDALFCVDREGRVIAQIGFNQAAAFPDFELGGYPAVMDAIHGFLRDDTWVLGGKMYRVVARPIEPEDFATAPLGAIVGLRAVDTSFAKELSKRTRTSLAFYASGARVASASTNDDIDDGTLEQVTKDLAGLANDKGYNDTGHSDVMSIDDKTSVLYARLPGEAWDLGGGFAVMRTRVAIAGPTGFLSGADDTDKKSVNFGLIAGVVLLGIFVGIGFSLLEHNLPVRELVKQAEKLKKGELDFLQIAKFRGTFRTVAADVNTGIERVVEKGGGAGRKVADLQQILGTAAGQPAAMSAFSFPQAPGDSAATQPAPQGPPRGFPGAPSQQGNPMGPGGAPHAHGSQPQLGYPPPQVPQAHGSNPNVGRPPPPPPRPAAGGIGGAFPLDPTLMSSGVEGGGHANAGAFGQQDEQEEATMVGQVPADVLAAATGQHAALAQGQGSQVTAQSGLSQQDDWIQVFNEFVRTKRECGEPVEGLTYPKFEQTLIKNRDALIARHNCKRVRFSVYVKEGRASLKATPVKE
jgi:hypothetical protein